MCVRVWAGGGGSCEFVEGLCVCGQPRTIP